MTIWALVPVKPFLRSKSRLAGVLSPRARAGLSRRFLGHALDVLAQVPALARTLVISRDPAARALARARGAQTLREPAASDLNQALWRGTQAALAAGAQAVLVLPTDLPFLAVEDVLQLIGAARAPDVALAPDRHGTGTNALFVRPAGLFRYAFGGGSFERHLNLARAAGAAVRVCRLPGVALDVDGPDDLRLYQTAQENANDH
jgi:2-phospho-L-lactate guanylyltransferase